MLVAWMGDCGQPAQCPLRAGAPQGVSDEVLSVDPGPELPWCVHLPTCSALATPGPVVPTATAVWSPEHMAMAGTLSTCARPGLLTYPGPGLMVEAWPEVTQPGSHQARIHTLSSLWPTVLQQTLIPWHTHRHRHTRA